MEEKNKLRSRLKLLRVLLILPLLATTEPNCLGVTKRSDALMDGSSTNKDFISTCPSATSFTTNAEPILQGRCIACHAVGGSAGPNFSLVSGTGLSTTQLNANYGFALKELLANDSGDPSTDPILARPIGGFGHSAIFSSQSDPDYASIYQWISDERASPCP